MSRTGTEMSIHVDYRDKNKGALSVSMYMERRTSKIKKISIVTPFVAGETGMGEKMYIVSFIPSGEQREKLDLQIYAPDGDHPSCLIQKY